MDAPADIKGTVLIWDRDTTPPEWDGPVFLWDSFKTTGNKQISLPAVLEQNAVAYRQKYLAFVYQLGESSVNGKTVIEHLEFHKGFSYWWLALIAQKDIVQFSPHIYDVLKLMAAEDYLKSGSVTGLVIESTKNDIIEIFRQWASERKITFKTAAGRQKSNEALLKWQIFRQGLWVFIKYTGTRFTLFRRRPETTPEASITFVDVLTHLEPSAAKTGIFASRYWTSLVDFLRRQNIAVSWFHWYYRHQAINSMTDARNLVSDFNGHETKHKHILTDQYVYPGTCLSIVANFIRLNLLASKVSGIRLLCRPEGSQLNLWPIYRHDWYRSFFGMHAVLNLFFMVQVKSFVKRLPRQSLGIFIQENQSWEFILTYYWKRYSHGLLVSVAHTTIPFWDFRYYFDPRSFEAGSKPPPLADLMAINGPDQFTKLKGAGFPVDKTIALEALRYMHLNSQKRNASTDSSLPLRLLVMGDLIPEITNSQLSFLKESLEQYKGAIKITFKPHPAVPSMPYELLAGITISNRTIGEELMECDVVFVNNITSGAADPYQLGIPVIVLNAGKGINFSPLFGRSEVFFVHEISSFVAALTEISQGSSFGKADFFNTDASLTEWKKMIQDNERRES